MEAERTSELQAHASAGDELPVARDQRRAAGAKVVHIRFDVRGEFGRGDDI